MLYFNTGEASNALFKELWHACAGPLVTVPQEGERVYYFPQGHMEQVNYVMYSVSVFIFYLCLQFALFIFSYLN